jgi:hypothetical protein
VVEADRARAGVECKEQAEVKTPEPRQGPMVGAQVAESL